MKLLPFLLLLPLVAACSWVRETVPDRSAIEQLLVSTAVDHMVEKVDISFPEGTRLFVVSEKLDDFDGTYAVGAIRDKLARSGGALVGERTQAEVIAEVRAGALSVDQSEKLVGIPRYEIPVPLTEGFAFPEIALWKRELKQGVVKVAITTYDAKTGQLRDSIRPVYGFSYRAHYDVLLFFGWDEDDLVPEGIKPKRGSLW